MQGFGDAESFSGLTAPSLNAPIVSITSTVDGRGYWLLASDGGVFTYGDAQFYGSTGNLHLNQPVVGMAASPSGHGYWLVAADGGIFSYGDAQFYGSTGNLNLNKPVVGMAPTPSGQGYFLVASDGGVFAFGDAQFQGSMGGTLLNQPVVGMSTDPSTGGYWEVAADGGIFSFDAPFFGSTGGDQSESADRRDDQHAYRHGLPLRRGRRWRVRLWGCTVLWKWGVGAHQEPCIGIPVNDRGHSSVHLIHRHRLHDGSLCQPPAEPHHARPSPTRQRSSVGFWRR